MRSAEALCFSIQLYAISLLRSAVSSMLSRTQCSAGEIIQCHLCFFIFRPFWVSQNRREMEVLVSWVSWAENRANVA